MANCHLEKPGLPGKGRSTAFFVGCLCHCTGLLLIFAAPWSFLAFIFFRVQVSYKHGCVIRTFIPARITTNNRKWPRLCCWYDVCCDDAGRSVSARTTCWLSRLSESKTTCFGQFIVDHTNCIPRFLALARPHHSGDQTWTRPERAHSSRSPKSRHWSLAETTERSHSECRKRTAELA